MHLDAVITEGRRIDYKERLKILDIVRCSFRYAQHGPLRLHGLVMVLPYNLPSHQSHPRQRAGFDLVAP